MLVLLGGAGVTPAASQELRLFYCFVAAASADTLYVSQTLPVGPTAERASYGKDFATHLAAQGLRVSGEGSASCVMRATEREIAFGRAELASFCPARDGAFSPSCGKTWTVREVEWPRASNSAGLTSNQPPATGADGVLSKGGLTFDHEWGGADRNGWVGALSHGSFEVLRCVDKVVIARVLDPSRFSTLPVYWYNGQRYSIPPHIRSAPPASVEFNGHFSVWSSLPTSVPGLRSTFGAFRSQAEADGALGCSGSVLAVSSIAALVGPTASPREAQLYLAEIFFVHSTRVPPLRDPAVERWIQASLTTMPQRR